MPTTEQHLRQAQHNEAFLATFDLGITPYRDWAATVTFYAALHYLRALMARNLYTNVSTYADMDTAFTRLGILKRHAEIYDAYRQLKDDSRAARYDAWLPTGADVLDMQEELRKIREFVVANV